MFCFSLGKGAIASGMFCIAVGDGAVARGAYQTSVKKPLTIEGWEPSSLMEDGKTTRFELLKTQVTELQKTYRSFAEQGMCPMAKANRGIKVLDQVLASLAPIEIEDEDAEATTAVPERKAMTPSPVASPSAAAPVASAVAPTTAVTPFEKVKRDANGVLECSSDEPLDMETLQKEAERLGLA